MTSTEMYTVDKYRNSWNKREISKQEQQATYIRNKVEVALNLPTANPNLPTATSNLSTSLFKNDNSNLTIEINIGKGIVKKCVSTIVEIVLCMVTFENQEELARGKQIQKIPLDLSKWTLGHVVRQK